MIRKCAGTFGWLMLGVLALPAAAGAVPYTYAYVRDSAQPGGTTSQTRLDGGTAAASRSGPTEGGSHQGMAQTTIGTNQVYARRNTLGTIHSTEAVSNWAINFGLSQDATLTIHFGWEVILDEPAADCSGSCPNEATVDPFDTRGSSASWSLAVGAPQNPTYYADLSITNNILGPGECLETRGANPTGSTNHCQGDHVTAGALVFDFFAGGPARNTLSVNMFAAAHGLATVDSYGTFEILGIIVPDGVTWTYDSVAGNPLNFQYAAVPPPPPVPEPGLLLTSLAGLCFVARRRQSRRSDWREHE